MSLTLTEEMTLHGDVEVAGVLTTLNELAERASNPVLRECLESAMEEILHLTGS